MSAERSRGRIPLDDMEHAAAIAVGCVLGFEIGVAFMAGLWWLL